MKVIIIDDYENYVTRIYGKVKQGNHTVLIGYDGKNLVEQALENGVATDNIKIIPLLTIPFMEKDIWLNAFGTALSDQNIRTDNENLLKGKLTATEKHLEDMRTIALKLLK